MMSPLPSYPTGESLEKTNRDEAMELYQRTDAPPADLFDAGTPKATPAHFSEPTLFFDPPYRSAADDAVAWQLVRHLHPACGLQYRQPVADLAVRPVDFVIEKSGRRIGIDLLEEAPDPEREALIISTGTADVLYRIEASSLVQRICDVLFLLSRQEPALFPEEERRTLFERASKATRRAANVQTGATVSVTYVEELMIDGELVAWPSKEVLSVTKNTLEHVLPHIDAARRRFQIDPDALGRRYARSA